MSKLNPLVTNGFRSTENLRPYEVSTLPLVSTVYARALDLVCKNAGSNQSYKTLANLRAEYRPYSGSIRLNEPPERVRLDINTLDSQGVAIPTLTYLLPAEITNSEDITRLRIAVSNIGEMVAAIETTDRIYLVAGSLVNDCAYDKPNMGSMGDCIRSRRFVGGLVKTVRYNIENFSLFMVEGHDPQPFFATGNNGNLSDFRLYYVRGSGINRELVLYRPPVYLGATAHLPNSSELLSAWRPVDLYPDYQTINPFLGGL